LDCGISTTRMSPFGQLLPIAETISRTVEGRLIGESRHSSKEFICSVRPSLNDRFRLQAAVRRTKRLHWLKATTGHKLPVVGHNLNGSFRSASDHCYWCTSVRLRRNSWPNCQAQRRRVPRRTLQRQLGVIMGTT